MATITTVPLKYNFYIRTRVQMHKLVRTRLLTAVDSMRRLTNFMLFFLNLFFRPNTMKLLESSSFEALGSRLCVETGESRILGR